MCLVKHSPSNQYYALKILKKQDILAKREAAFFMEEKESLLKSFKAQWLPQFYASFQDERFLYLLMEFVPGGSLRGLLDRTEALIEEKDVQFYISEMILAIEEVHQLGYLHR